MPTKPRQPLPSLPVEIWDTILSLSRDTDLQGLCAFSLTCRAGRQLAQPHILRRVTVIVSIMNRDVPSLLKSVQAVGNGGSGIGCFVRVLDIVRSKYPQGEQQPSFDVESLHHLLLSLPAMQELRVTDAIIAPLHSQTDSSPDLPVVDLDRLILSHVTAELWIAGEDSQTACAIARVLAFISIFGQVGHLTMDGIRMDGIRGDFMSSNRCSTDHASFKDAFTQPHLLEPILAAHPPPSSQRLTCKDGT
ncbi:hypothetical protein EIP91_010862 [Steccherinum ochraceum]|uniref:F-box domain-containing protein n=1 Tax=Steccherinum ochraceum TaxID=92696 RepID=A0A4R0R057_9APHY|nr:hypothetical protein EIP91_010862 [Steccherinum ochraceum]